MYKLSRSEQLIVLFLVGVILVGVAVASVRKYLGNKEGSRFLTTENISSPGERNSSQEIIIHITGAVKKPGVYQIKKGTRVFEAIKIAGGAKKEALLDILNLAKPVEDGSKIVIPHKFDVEAFRRKLLSYGPEHVYTTEELRLAYGEFEKEAQEKKKPKPGISEKGKININTASQAQLESLPSIGPKRADAIIAHRPYQSSEELTRIHGFGPKTYKALKDKITVE